MADPERLADIRRNRVAIMNEKNLPSYTNLESIRKELEESKELFKKYNWPIIRKLLTASNYTLMVLPTADTWYDGWEKDAFLIYTKSKKGNCAIVSETTAKHPEPYNGTVEWKCK